MCWQASKFVFSCALKAFEGLQTFLTIDITVFGRTSAAESCNLAANRSDHQNRNNDENAVSEESQRVNGKCWQSSKFVFSCALKAFERLKPFLTIDITEFGRISADESCNLSDILRKSWLISWISD